MLRKPRPANISDDGNIDLRDDREVAVQAGVQDIFEIPFVLATRTHRNAWQNGAGRREKGEEISFDSAETKSSGRSRDRTEANYFLIIGTK